MKSCIIIRCTIVGHDEKFLHSKLSAVIPSGDIFYCVDRLSKPAPIGNRNVSALDRKFLERRQLFFAGNLTGWRCGDYFYYKIWEDQPDYDFYYMIEPDVGFTENTLRSWITTKRIQPTSWHHSFG